MAWLTNWNYRKPIIINNNSGGSLTDYQIRITVTFVTAKMNVDFSDVRFAYDNGTNISYWLESKTDSSTAIIWIKVNLPIYGTPSPSGDNIVYMYYGNSGATSVSSYENTRSTVSTSWSADPSIVGEYLFDGNANDTSGNGHNGTSNGSYVTGKFGNAADLTTSQSITIANTADFDPIIPFSISIWAKFDDLSHNNTLWWKGWHPSGYAVFVYAGGTAMEIVKFGTINQVGYLPITLTNGNWYHIVAVQSPTQIDYYVNGVWMDNYIHTGAYNANASGVQIGTTPQSEYNLDGQVDQIRFFKNRALSASDVMVQYLGRAYVSTEPTVTYPIGTEETQACGTPSANLIVLEMVSNQLSKSYPSYIDLYEISRLIDNYTGITNKYE